MSPSTRVIACLAFSVLCLAVAWLWPRVGLWWRLRQAAVAWRAREDMEAALWAECNPAAKTLLTVENDNVVTPRASQ